MGTRSESVGNKKKECNVVGLGLRLSVQENASSFNKRMMVSPHNRCDNHESVLLSSSSCCGFDGSGSNGESMFCNTSNQIACMSDVYDVAGAASGSGKSLNLPNSDSFFPFNSSGEMTASAVSVNMRVQPFTAAQLQELERQTLMYKYLMHYVPVPNELLFPVTINPSSAPTSQPTTVVQGSTELGLLSNNNSDPEPWRCRRTDGKKWRCSRDVAPDQKYCERHSHKSRPRSRKPVEPSHLINNSRNQINVTQPLNLASDYNIVNKSFEKSHFLSQNFASSILSTGQQQQRSLDWFMKRETTPVASNSNQEWLQMMQSRLESNGDRCRYDEQHRDHLINSNSYTNLGGDNLAFQAQQPHDQYSLLLNPKNSHQAQTQETRHFIDGWSIAGGNIANEGVSGSNCFVSPNEKLPLPSLTLSMCGGCEPIERNENALMNTIGSMGCSEGEENVGTMRPPWMNHVSGMGSPPGGPLAEALCLGIASSAKSDSNAASPYGCSTSS